MQVKIWFIAVLFLPLMSWANPDKNLIDVTVRLKWFHQFQFAGIYAAKDKGFYRQQGLNVTILARNPSTSPLDDVLSGQVDFGISDTTIIRNRLQGKPVVLLAAIFQHSPLVLLTLAKDNLLSPLELKDKRVMYQEGVDEAIIVGMFNEFGLKKDNFIHVAHSYRDDALLKDNTDAMSAYISNQPFFYQQQGVKINIINPANYGIDFYGDVLFTSEDFLKKHPDVAIKFRQATLKGWEYALEHPNEIINLILNKYQTKKSYAHLKFEAQKTQQMVADDLVEIGHINPKRLAQIARQFQKYEPELRHHNPEEIAEKIYYRYYLEKGKYEYIRDALIVIALSVITLLTLIGILIFVNKRLKKRIKAKTRALEQAKEQMESYLNLLDKYVIVIRINLSGHITHVSKALNDLFNYQLDELIGKPIDFLFHPEQEHTPLKEIISEVKEKSVWMGECALTDKKEQNYWLRAWITGVYDEKGQLINLVCIYFDISERKKIEKISMTDPLTGIANRLKINEVLMYEYKKAIRYHSYLSLALIDIDHFKQVNDEYGHLVGDEVLSEMSLLLQKYIRTTDLLGRFGGEEFIIIFSNTSVDGAYDSMNSFQHMLNRQKISSLHLSISVSIGIAELQNNEQISDFIEAADKAMYEAKNSGRNCIKKGSNKRGR